jgi:hypothetical protein
MDSDSPKFDAELLQARWVLDSIEPVEMVSEAIAALEAGFTGSAIQELAGLSLPTRSELGTLPERTFREMGLTAVTHEQAIERVCDKGVVFTSVLIRDLVESSPGFRNRWKEHVAFWGGKAAGSYNDIAEFVHFTVEDLYEKGAQSEVRAVFELMENAIVNGSEETKGLVSVGFLETLQCVTSWKLYGIHAFEQFLGPNSLVVWEDLQILWRGKGSLADVIRAQRLEDKG